MLITTSYIFKINNYKLVKCLNLVNGLIYLLSGINIVLQQFETYFCGIIYWKYYGVF